MKFCCYRKGKQVRYGVLEKERVVPLIGDIFGEWKKSNLSFSLDEVDLLPPCRPSKIIGVGLNYRDHAAELNMPLPETPLLFLKAPTSVIGHKAGIVYPEATKDLHYEAELGIVIKDTCKDIHEEDAKDHILGYTCANDVTARDLQKSDGQWTRAKSFDTFMPFGPFIVNGIDTGSLEIKLTLNGEIKQRSNTSRMIFKPGAIVSFISGIMTLLPGDLIITGTPPAVGPMKSGDTVEIEIESIGKLINTVS
jgi:2-keto-4-pentenoate hydratase/2-oxohepta-3-ene-1,7-dioic acid hydratase in catechol pathway